MKKNLQNLDRKRRKNSNDLIIKKPLNSIRKDEKN